MTTYQQRSLIVASNATPLPVTTVFTDEADARGTVFVPPQLPENLAWVMEGVVQQIEQWREAGMPMGALPWQAAPTEVVEFRVPAGEFFPPGFLAQFELDQAGQTHLYLSARRIHEDRALDEQVAAWTRKCYLAVRHYYRVLRPLQDLPISIVRVFW